MHRKIKEIRMGFGLSETQISSMLYISSYKYRRYESGSLVLTVEVLSILAIIYGVPLDYLVFDRFSVDLILEEIDKKGILSIPDNERIKVIVSNMCKYCTFDCTSINYRVVKNILAQFLDNFSINLYTLRNLNSIEISQISDMLCISAEHYLDLESGNVWPTIYELIKIGSIFSLSINDLMIKKMR